MKSYKNFISDIRTKKAGLDHPVVHDERNKPIHGKDVSSYKVPVDVHDEFEGKKGKHILKSKEGKYEISKGENNE